MNEYLTIVLSVLAVWEILEIWHHGTLFSSWRSTVENWDEGILGWWGELLTCMFCLAPWVSWLVVAVMLLLPYFCPDSPAVVVARGVIAGFAVARLANLGNDFTKNLCRTPRPGDDI